ncbi:MAG: hypothetical protein ACRDOI_04835 [Trebonia sp.]
MSTMPAIGSRVRVPWGRETVEGEVVEAYDSGFGKQVVVEVILEGCDQPLTATFRAEAVELAA